VPHLGPQHVGHRGSSNAFAGCLLPCRFLFKDQYIELSTAVPEDADLYGLGEVTLPSGLRLPRDGHIITLYNRDTPVATPYANLYGSHPFFLQVSKGAFEQITYV
jgi:alpha-glucosidase (family GH31 glycosyl hydrolase)